MHVIILIKKYNDTSLCWDYLTLHKKIQKLSVEDIVNRYQGFEGEIIFITLFGENESKIKNLEDESNLIKSKDTLLLHVLSDNVMPPNYLKGHLVHQGYDVGVCEEDKTLYSSIFNEILFGNLPELIVFQEFLNDNLLFPNKQIAEEYVSFRNELSLLQKDVEDYEEMVIYDIWKYSG